MEISTSDLNNYKLVIEYDGKKFCGWQRQKETKETIQEYLEHSIEVLLKEKVKLIGGGRTDTAVSAFNQVANFKTPKKLVRSKFLYQINSILPKEIAVKKITKVKEDFHSRYSAKKREYLYFITTRKRSIRCDDYYFLKSDPDWTKADKLISFLKKNKYYKSLCKNKTDKYNFSCKIKKLSYKEKKSDSQIIFTISADRFLHSMVRAIIGTLIDVSRNKFEVEDIISKIKRGEKLKTTYLPANALFLNKIIYK